MRDTAEHILDMQKQIYHAMSFERRMMIAFEMSDELIGIQSKAYVKTTRMPVKRKLCFCW